MEKTYFILGPQGSGKTELAKRFFDTYQPNEVIIHVDDGSWHNLMNELLLRFTEQTKVIVLEEMKVDTMASLINEKKYSQSLKSVLSLPTEKYLIFIIISQLQKPLSLFDLVKTFNNGTFIFTDLKGELPA